MRSITLPGEEPTLILFHGTGGDENDLIALARHVAPTHAIRSYRGITSENGMLRWFPRTGMNTFDETTVREHIDAMIAGIREDYSDEELASSILIGYSNGANAIAAMMQRGLAVRRAALLHPMLVLDDENTYDADLFVTLGERDRMIPREEAEKLIEHLKTRGARIETYTSPSGHEIASAEADALRAWITARADPR